MSNSSFDSTIFSLLYPFSFSLHHIRPVLVTNFPPQFHPGPPGHHHRRARRPQQSWQLSLGRFPCCKTWKESRTTKKKLTNWPWSFSAAMTFKGSRVTSKHHFWVTSKHHHFGSLPLSNMESKSKSIRFATHEVCQSKTVFFPALQHSFPVISEVMQTLGSPSRVSRLDAEKVQRPK